MPTDYGLENVDIDLGIAPLIETDSDNVSHEVSHVYNARRSVSVESSPSDLRGNYA